MPRPTAAQFAYGSAAVVVSTLAMLLLSRTASGIGIAIVALAALALGVLVALIVATPKTAHTVLRTNPAAVSEAERTAHSAHSARQPTRAHSAVGGHSLRR
ncbi:hypothetical protein [Streptomyces hypolithicus]